MRLSKCVTEEKLKPSNFKTVINGCPKNWIFGYNIYRQLHDRYKIITDSMLPIVCVHNMLVNMSLTLWMKFVVMKSINSDTK